MWIETFLNIIDYEVFFLFLSPVRTLIVHIYSNPILVTYIYIILPYGYLLVQVIHSFNTMLQLAEVIGEFPQSLHWGFYLWIHIPVEGVNLHNVIHQVGEYSTTHLPMGPLCLYGFDTLSHDLYPWGRSGLGAHGMYQSWFTSYQSHKPSTDQMPPHHVQIPERW